MSKYFKIISSRLHVEENELVIARYCALPFYKELEEDILSKNAKLINTTKQHRWIADIGNWSSVIYNFTPNTWRKIEEVPDDAFPVVVKGETNSMKFKWDTHMFAPNRTSAINIMCNLMDDGVIGYQHIYFRKFIPLKTFLIGLRGMPVTNEFRIFVYNKQILSKGFYWSNYIDDINVVPNPESIPENFLSKVIELIGDNAMFYTLDVAETENGDWIVIEINDGQMSGLSDNNPEILYSNLKNVLDKQ